MASIQAQPQQGGGTGQTQQQAGQSQADDVQAGKIQAGQQQQGQLPGGVTPQAGQPIFRDWASI